MGLRCASLPRIPESNAPVETLVVAAGRISSVKRVTSFPAIADECLVNESQRTVTIFRMSFGVGTI